MHHGEKHLVLDKKISGLLSHILSEAPKLLQDNGVVQISELGSENQDEDKEYEHVIFFVRPVIEHMKAISRQILMSRRKQKNQSGESRYSIYFSPHKTLMCEQVLEDEGVLDFVEPLGEYQLNLIPLDTDLISLELDGCFRDCKLEGDMSSLQAVTQSLIKLRSFYGLIPNVKSIGPLSRNVCNKLMRNEQAHAASKSDPSTPPLIDTLILIDREVDLVTPLVTPLTYEGLIDELIGIKNTVIKVDKKIAGTEENKDEAHQWKQFDEDSFVRHALRSQCSRSIAAFLGWLVGR